MKNLILKLRVVLYCSVLLLSFLSSSAQMQSVSQQVLGGKGKRQCLLDIPEAWLGKEMIVQSWAVSSSPQFPGVKFWDKAHPGTLLTGAIIRITRKTNALLNLEVLDYRINNPNSLYDLNNTGKVLSNYVLPVLKQENEFCQVNMADLLLKPNTCFHIGALLQRSFGLDKKTPEIKVEQMKGDDHGLEVLMELNYHEGGWLRINTSLYPLPEKPMQPRLQELRVNYYPQAQLDLKQANPDPEKSLQLATRWRLEPKPEDLERYSRGGLVEPVKPIVFYLNPSTPKRWIPYIIKGVNAWNQAFERAGFKNAIIGKLAPTAAEDPDFNLFDHRHSVIHWLDSDIENGWYRTIVDPRTGEILQAHILASNGFLKMAERWYFTQASASAGAEKNLPLSEELMGQMVTDFISHEVGHTLGMPHNMFSSATVPVKQLRNPKWVAQHGIAPSIMDYARCNYVAQPMDGVTGKGLRWGIGEYDKWAIEWAYRYFTDPWEQQTKELERLTTVKNREKQYLSLPEGTPDPRCESEMLGDDVLASGTYGIANLKLVLGNLKKQVATLSPELVKDMYKEVLTQFARYQGYAVANIGGHHYHWSKDRAQKKELVKEPVPDRIQLHSIRFLNTQLFEPPIWLLDATLLQATGSDPLKVMTDVQKYPLTELWNSGISRVMNYDGRSEILADRLIKELFEGIFSGHSLADVYRQNLQNTLLELMQGSSKKVHRAGNELTPAKKAALSAIVNKHLRQLKPKLTAELQKCKAESTRAHLNSMLEKINKLIL